MLAASPEITANLEYNFPQEQSEVALSDPSLLRPEYTTTAELQQLSDKSSTSESASTLSLESPNEGYRLTL